MRYIILPSLSLQHLCHLEHAFCILRYEKSSLRGVVSCFPSLSATVSKKYGYLLGSLANTIPNRNLVSSIAPQHYLIYPQFERACTYAIGLNPARCTQTWQPSQVHRRALWQTISRPQWPWGPPPNKRWPPLDLRLQCWLHSHSCSSLVSIPDARAVWPCFCIAASCHSCWSACSCRKQVPLRDPACPIRRPFG